MCEETTMKKSIGFPREDNAQRPLRIMAGTLWEIIIDNHMPDTLLHVLAPTQGQHQGASSKVSNAQ